MRRQQYIVLAFALAACSLSLLAWPSAQIRETVPGRPFGRSVKWTSPMPSAVCDTLRAEYAKLPDRSAEHLGAMLNRAAWAHRAESFGLSRKDFGNQCPSLAGPVACDILHRKNGDLLYDVLTDSGVNCGGGEPRPVSSDPDYWARRPWVAPVDPGGTPPPPPPPCDWPDQRQEVVRLQEQVAGLEGERDAARARVEVLERERAQLKEQAAAVRDHATIVFTTEPSTELKAQLALLGLQWRVGDAPSLRCKWDWGSLSCRPR